MHLEIRIKKAKICYKIIDINLKVNIIKVKILKGYFPKRQLKLILAWTEIHKDELMQNWELARNHEALYRIAPLT